MGSHPDEACVFKVLFLFTKRPTSLKTPKPDPGTRCALAEQAHCLGPPSPRPGALGPGPGATEPVSGTPGPGLGGPGLYDRFSQGGEFSSCGEGPDDSGAVIKWFNAFGDLVASMAKSSIQDAVKKLNVALNKLTNPLDAFSDASPSAAAEELKAFENKVVSAADCLEVLMKTFGVAPVDESVATVLNECQKALATCTQKSVTWGVWTLLSIKVIRHPQKGKAARIKLDALYQEHLKDADSSDMKSKAEEVLAIKTSDKAEPEVAAPKTVEEVAPGDAASSDAPAKKRRKSAKSTEG
jgi:hypothetical protein